MDYISNLFMETEGSGSSLTYVEPSVSYWTLIPILIVFFILLASPAIQLTLSTKKNKYVGLIFPAFTFVVFGVIMLVVNPSSLPLALMTVATPLALIIFHIIIRKNMRY